MGYTHYWKRAVGNAPPKAWAAFTADVTKILARARTLHDDEGKLLRLPYESDEPTRPAAVTASEVRFNGLAEKGHETFYFSLASLPFAFCKTARKPYDVAVCAVLLAAHHHLKAEVLSDGSWAEWQAGRDLYTAATGRPAVQPWKEE